MTAAPPTGSGGLSAGGLVVVAQARSSGASTATIALAVTWPQPVLVAELDPAGGDIATRFGLSANVGVLSLAASGAGDVGADALAEHTQVADGLAVLVGPPGAEQAEVAMAGLWSGLPPVLSNLPGRHVLADCGRLDPASKIVGSVLPHAGVVVLVSRADREGFVRLHHRLATSPVALRARAVLLLVGEGQRGCRAVDFERALATEVVGVLADDWRGAAMVSAGQISGRAFRSSALARSARPIAETLASRLVPAAERAPAGPVSDATVPSRPQVVR